jgi:hypothetical protein
MDNVPITAGSGTTIAADEIAGAYYQRIKLTHGADGTATDASAAAPLPVEDSNSDDLLVAAEALAAAVAGTEVQVDIVAALPAGTNNIGEVDVASIAAGENLIGLVGASDIVVTVTPTCDTSAYASGDLIFDSTEVAAAVRANGGHCVLHSVVVHDKADQGVAMTLVLLNANTDMGTLNSAPDPDDTEAGTIIGWIPVAASDYFDVGASDVACIRNIGLGLKAGAATTSIWIAGVNGTGTPTFGASDLVISLYFMRA